MHSVTGIIASHKNAYWATGINLVHLVVETLPGWSQEAVETIKFIGRLPVQGWACLLMKQQHSYRPNSVACRSAVDGECLHVGYA